MYVLRYTCLSVSRHVLFVSASIPVSICTGTYPSPYLHVFLFDICTYPSQYTARIPFVSELIPVRICLCPVCVCICNLMPIRPNIGPAGQPNYHTHTHTHTQLLTHPRSLCRLFLTPVRKRRCVASAASATASAGVTARSCLPLHRFPS